MIKWANQLKGLCVICSTSLSDSSFFLCRSCNQICQINSKDLNRGDGYTVIDMKSKCCNADIQLNQKQTCSDKCHEELIQEMEKEFGKHKKIVDSESGIAYRVPTRQIIEKGIRQEELVKFPKWN